MPRILPSELDFFQQQWVDDRGRVFKLEQHAAKGPIQLLEALSRFMRWEKKEKRQHFFEVAEQLAEWNDANHDTVEGLRDIIRQYNNGRWEESVIATLSKTASKKLLYKHVHVNIHDYINGSDVQFDTCKKLRLYTFGSHKVFPLQAAKADGLTAALLKDFSRGRQQKDLEVDELMAALTV